MKSHFPIINYFEKKHIMSETYCELADMLFLPYTYKSSKSTKKWKKRKFEKNIMDKKK